MSLRCLIAEDDRISRTFLSEFLSDYGHCDATSDGMEALDAILDAIKKKEPYDLLCLDIMMPKVDGLRVLKVLRKVEAQQKIPPEKRLRVIIMTAIADMEYVDEAFRLGCDAYASKPIDTDQVLETMKSLGLLE